MLHLFLQSIFLRITMCTIKCILNVILLAHNKPLNTNTKRRTDLGTLEVLSRTLRYIHG